MRKGGLRGMCAFLFPPLTKSGGDRERVRAKLRANLLDRNGCNIITKASYNNKGAVYGEH
jgi:hypothetical protein